MAIQYRLEQRPESGTPPKWCRSTDLLPALKEGEARLSLDYISIDPGMMGWVTDKKSYMPPIAVGDVMRAFGVGTIVESNKPDMPVGTQLTGFTGVQTELVVSKKSFLRPVSLPKGLPLSHAMSALGMPGYTGYFGMTDIGQPKPGDTVVVSAAAGAVGSVASQVARSLGATVIGIAGGKQKTDLLREHFKLDGVVDYKAENVAEALGKLCPNGVDVYFDNVGGETLDALIDLMKPNGRLVICGAISQYDDMTETRGPKNFINVVTQSLMLQGFTMKDYFHRIPEANEALSALIASGDLVVQEHILEGIDAFPDGFDMIFKGGNLGKLMIKV